MIQSKRQGIFLIYVMTVAFMIWFSWRSYRQARIKIIETKVNQAFASELTALSPRWPRIETHNGLNTYYSPKVDSAQTLEVYRYILEDLNQDASLPPLKLSPPAITKTFGASEDTLTGQMTLTFPVLGIDTKIMVFDIVKIAHYASNK